MNSGIDIFLQKNLQIWVVKTVLQAIQIQNDI